MLSPRPAGAERALAGFGEYRIASAGGHPGPGSFHRVARGDFRRPRASVLAAEILPVVGVTYAFRSARATWSLPVTGG